MVETIFFDQPQGISVFVCVSGLCECACEWVVCVCVCVCLSVCVCVCV
jgi:hypothetical protein